MARLPSAFNRTDTFSRKQVHALAKQQRKATRLQNGLQRQATRRLARLSRLEHEMLAGAGAVDSFRVMQDLGTFPEYKRLTSAASDFAPINLHYSGRLDSLATALKFFTANSSGLQAATATIKELNSLQEHLSGATGAATILTDRYNLLKAHLESLRASSSLQRYQKELAAYKAAVSQYQALVEEPDRWAELLIAAAQRLPQFQQFFARHSQLGQLFALPGAEGNAAAPVAGLQTRSALNQEFRNRFGERASLSAALEQGMQSAQAGSGGMAGQLNAQLPSSSGHLGADHIKTPEYKSKTQKGKTLGQRLELGTNFQSQRARSFFPVTTDLGMFIGYKLNNRSVVGVGASYKLGWGKGWDNITLSHQGVGLRSFVDVQLKGSIYISGGYEQNYRTVFGSIAALKNYNAWQSSGLLGLTKKYKAGKFQGNMQLLWDFLSQQQVPHTQAIVWRVGYNLK